MGREVENKMGREIGYTEPGQEDYIDEAIQDEKAQVRLKRVTRIKQMAKKESLFKCTINHLWDRFYSWVYRGSLLNDKNKLVHENILLAMVLRDLAGLSVDEIGLSLQERESKIDQIIMDSYKRIYKHINYNQE